MAHHLPATHQPTLSLPFTATERWTVVGMILASGIVFLDGTVVNVALPAIDRNLHIGLSGQQWVIDGYTLGLAALLLLGGALGDHYGRRRVMLIGLVGFGVASVLCAAAPTGGFLIAARAFQGVAGAFLVPASLAIITAVFTNEEERGQAIGMWTGWSGIATVIGPFLGGWLVDAASWRWAFVINVPLIGVAIVLLLRHVPETRDAEAARRLDWVGAALAAIGLGGMTLALIEGPVRGWHAPLVLGGGIASVAALILFIVVEARREHPMVPLGFFRVRNFAAANLATLGVYFALGGATFLIVLFMQSVMGYTALETGLSLLPLSILMLLFASRFGKLAGRYGPRLFMTIGPLVVAAGLLLFARLDAGSGYLTGVLPASVILALGLCITVAPLTTTVMTAVPAHNAGIASAINNVASRVAGLLAVAGLGVVVAVTFASALDARVATLNPGPDSTMALARAKQDPAARPAPELPPEVARAITDAYTVSFHRAMWWCAAAAALGGLISGLMIRTPPAHGIPPQERGGP